MGAARPAPRVRSRVLPAPKTDFPVICQPAWRRSINLSSIPEDGRPCDTATCRTTHERGQERGSTTSRLTSAKHCLAPTPHPLEIDQKSSPAAPQPRPGPQPSPWLRAIAPARPRNRSPAPQPRPGSPRRIWAPQPRPAGARTPWGFGRRGARVAPRERIGPVAATGRSGTWLCYASRWTMPKLAIGRPIGALGER
jgi:hypothetical protein